MFAVLFALAFAAVAAYVYLLYTRAQTAGHTGMFALTAKTEEGTASKSTEGKLLSTTDGETANGTTNEESKEAYHKL